MSFEYVLFPGHVEEVGVENEVKMYKYTPGFMDPRTNGILCGYHKIREVQEVGDGIFFPSISDMVLFLGMTHISKMSTRQK